MLTLLPSLRVCVRACVRAQEDVAQDQRRAKEVQAALEWTTLQTVTRKSEIYFDPDPTNTVVVEDQHFVREYFVMESDLQQRLSPWMLRIELEPKVVADKRLLMAEIAQSIETRFDNDVSVAHSDDNDAKLVLQVRVKREHPAADPAAAAAEAAETGAMEADDGYDHAFMKGLEQELLQDMELRGLRGISKVYMRQPKRTVWSDEEGFQQQEEWVLDTDGTNLREVLAHPDVDASRTTSNDIREIFEALGVEAVRAALLHELRSVISFDGAYVNYRHLA
ncbi:MAG: hypothetical protein ACK4IB_11770, partial [Erythrobacter sp.]